jgi:DNA polymerase/3'-5' exonuclease PolX
VYIEIAYYKMNIDPNRFKSVAFRRAAHILRDYPTQIRNGSEARKLVI